MGIKTLTLTIFLLFISNNLLAGGGTPIVLTDAEKAEHKKLDEKAAQDKLECKASVQEFLSFLYQTQYCALNEEKDIITCWFPGGSVYSPKLGYNKRKFRDIAIETNLFGTKKHVDKGYLKGKVLRDKMVVFIQEDYCRSEDAKRLDLGELLNVSRLSTLINDQK